MDKDQVFQNSRKTVRILTGLSIFLLIFGSLEWFDSQQSISEAATAQSNLFQVALALGTTSAQRDVAQQQARIALARQTSAQAELLLTADISNRTSATLLAIESMRLFPSGDASQLIENAFMYPNIYVDSIGHSITSFTPDGEYFISAGWDGEIRIWNAHFGEEIIRISTAAEIFAMDISPDGRYIAYASSDGTARVWDRLAKYESSRIIQESNPISIAFCPNGQCVASSAYEWLGDNVGKYQGTVRVWEVATGREMSRTTFSGQVYSFAFSPDGRWIVASGCDREATGEGCAENSTRIWNVYSGDEVARLQHDQTLYNVGYSGDGRYIISDDSGNSVYLWNSMTGERLKKISKGYASNLSVSPDGTQVFAACSYSICGWDAMTGDEILNIPAFGGAFLLTVSPDGKLLAGNVIHGMKKNDVVYVWDIETGKEITRLFTRAQVSSIAFSPSGQYLLTGGSAVSIWEIIPGQGIPKIELRGNFLSQKAFSPNDHYVISLLCEQWHQNSSCARNTATVLDALTGKSIARMSHSSDPDNFMVIAAAFSPDGKHIVTSGTDKTTRVWDAFTGTEISRMAKDSLVTSVVYSPDGESVLTNSDNAVCIWNAFTGLRRICKRSDVTVLSIAYNPDGNKVAHGDKDGFVYVWDAITGKEVSRLLNGEQVISVVFSPNGKHLAVSSELSTRIWDFTEKLEVAQFPSGRAAFFSLDGRYVFTEEIDSVHVWDIEIGNEVFRTSFPFDPTSIALSSDGEYLLLGNKGWVSGWKWRPEDLIAYACSLVKRNFTQLEWMQYFSSEEYRATCPNLPIEAESTLTP